MVTASPCLVEPDGQGNQVAVGGVSGLQRNGEGRHVRRGGRQARHVAHRLLDRAFRQVLGEPGQGDDGGAGRVEPVFATLSIG